MNTPTPKNVRSPGRGRLALLPAVTIGILLTAGCADTPAGVLPPENLSLSIVAGDSQIGTPLTELPVPIVIKLWDSVQKKPARDQIVNFVVTGGGGSVFAGVAQTDKSGIATEYWTLGDPGPQHLEVRAVSADGAKHVFGAFVAWAVVPFDSTLAVLQCFHGFTMSWRSGACSPGDGSAQVGTTVPVQFRVLNADSLPLAGVTVFAVVDTLVGDSVPQNGMVIPDSAVTDTLGTVTLLWQLGDTVGTNHLVGAVPRDTASLYVDVWVEGVPGPPPTDTLPPVLMLLGIEPDTVVLDSGSAWVAFTGQVLDDVGVTQVVFSIGKVPWGWSCPASLVGGTPQNGAWRCWFQVPDTTWSLGTWWINGVMLRDAPPDSVFLTTAQLDSLGFETTFVVTDAPAVADSIAPVLTGLTLMPDTVVLDSAPWGSVRFDLQVTDDVGAWAALVRLRAPGDSILRYCWGSQIAGGVPTALWRCWFTVTDSTHHLGNWWVDAVELRGPGPDSLPGIPSQLVRTLTTTELEGLGYPTGFVVFAPGDSAAAAALTTGEERPWRPPERREPQRR